jgi:tetratricopeptide (TPR) repeat protein
LRSLECDPSHANAQSLYADFLAYSRGQYSQALRMYESSINASAVVSGGDASPYLLNNYACLLCCCNQYEKALVVFQEAVRRYLSLCSDGNFFAAGEEEMEFIQPYILRNYALFLEDYGTTPEQKQLAHHHRKLYQEHKKIFSSISSTKSIY